MRFLLDQDVYAETARFLCSLGHDVVTAHASGWSRASDAFLLEEAHAQHRLLVTRDRDYGALVFAGGQRGGVLYLRMRPSTATVVHERLERVLCDYSETTLQQGFVVVEADGYRFRHLAR